jgi:hypothetical protein
MSALKLVLSIVLFITIPNLKSQNSKEIVIIDIMDVRNDPYFSERLLNHVCDKFKNDNSLLLPLHYSQDVKKNKDVFGVTGDKWNCAQNKLLLDKWSNFRFRDLMLNSSSELVDFILGLQGVNGFLNANNGEIIDIVICINKNPNDDLDYEDLAKKLNLLVNDGKGEIKYTYNKSNYVEKQNTNYYVESI